MNDQNFQTDEEPADITVAARLAKLGSMPVDTSRLDRLIREQIPSPVRERRLWIRPMRAVVASVAVIAVLAAIFVTASSRPVLASTSEMARFHNDLVSGRVPVTQVDSMSAANKVLAAQWAQSPQMPNIPQDHVMACCMRSVKNKRMACVLLKGDGVPVTMTVANASDMKLPTSPVVIRNGIQYHVQTDGPLNMVMTQRDGRWVCLIATLSQNRLMDLASSLQF